MLQDGLLTPDHHKNSAKKQPVPIDFGKSAQTSFRFSVARQISSDCEFKIFFELAVEFEVIFTKLINT